MGDSHLPGVLNVEADAASREFNMRTKWMLRKDVFWDIAHDFYDSKLDLFASRLNHQLPLYVSRLPDPVLQRWMPFNRTGASGRVSSNHQWCYYLEFFRK